MPKVKMKPLQADYSTDITYPTFDSIIYNSMRMIVNRFMFSTQLSKFMNPPVLRIVAQVQLPVLKTKQSKLLLKNWWSQSPFSNLQPMFAPIFGLNDGTYTGQTIELQPEIFNKPLRRDLIYRLYDWRRNLNKFNTKHTRTVAEVASSGKKMRPQKGQGAARMGQRRAPGRRKGGKAHGAKAKVYSFHMNQKIKLAALKSLFSAKLVEGKIRIIDTERLPEAKTKLLWKALSKHLPEQATACIITSSIPDPNFLLANQNIQKIKCYTAQDFDVKDIFKLDKIIITQAGLQQLTSNILKSTYVVNRQPYMKNIESSEVKAEQETPFDPEKPIEFKFKILQDYLKLYEQVKIEKPQLLEKEFQKIKKIS